MTLPLDNVCLLYCPSYSRDFNGFSSFGKAGCKCDDVGSDIYPGVRYIGLVGLVERRLVLHWPEG